MKNRIIEARELSDLSQKELAERIGVSPSTLNGYEKGNHDPKSIGLIKIAQSCNVTTDFLLGLTDNPHQYASFHNNTAMMSDSEQLILEKYYSLNDEGRAKLIERADELRTLGYIKEDSQKMA